MLTQSVKSRGVLSRIIFSVFVALAGVSASTLARGEVPDFLSLRFFLLLGGATMVIFVVSLVVQALLGRES